MSNPIPAYESWHKRELDRSGVHSEPVTGSLCSVLSTLGYFFRSSTVVYAISCLILASALPQVILQREVTFHNQGIKVFQLEVTRVATS